jgi:hypothetical protein
MSVQIRPGPPSLVAAMRLAIVVRCARRNVSREAYPPLVVVRRTRLAILVEHHRGDSLRDGATAARRVLAPEVRVRPLLSQHIPR